MSESLGMSVRHRLIASLLLLVFVCQPLRAQSGSGYGSTSDEGDDGILYLLGAVLAGVVAASPIWVPKVMFEEDSWDVAQFYEYPYYDDRNEYLLLEGEAQAGVANWGATVATDYGVDSDIERFGTRLTLDTNSRIGIECEWADWCGALDRPWDEMQTGDAHLTWRFAQNPTIQFRAGLGFRWLHDELDTNYGFSGHYSVEMQPIRPVLASLRFEAGTLRHDAFLHGRASVGLIWKRFEVFAGFDYLQVDRIEAAGPVAGLRLWL